jgi:Undecaprenyl-phosphate galactose phosphotransferase WbaP
LLAVNARIFLGNAIEFIPEFSGDAMRFGDLYFMPALFVLVFAYEGLYRKRLPYIDELRDIGKSIVMLTVFLFALISVGKLAHIVSRMTILMMAPISLVLIATLRYWGKIWLHRLGFGTQNLLIIGEATAAAKIKSELLAERTLGYRFTGYIPVNPKESLRPKPQQGATLNRIGDIRDLPRVLKENFIACVLIAAPSLSRDKTSALADKVHRYVQHVLLIPEMRTGALLNSELYHLFVNQLFLIKMRNSLQERPARFSKMAFDYTLVLLALPVVIPVLGVIAGMIRFTSPGPALYSQIRTGKNGKPIRVYKFRSMYADAEIRLKQLLSADRKARAEWKKTLKLKNDPRVTRLGAFLRKTSLDELPQLINVLKGDMSLVGPRPVPEIELSEKYGPRSDFYRLVRPGMTGLWQISGRSDVSYPQRVDMDTWYVFNWSLYIDFVILYKTIGVVLKRRGAY